MILLYTLLFVTMYFRFNSCVTCNIFQVYFIVLLQNSLHPPFFSWHLIVSRSPSLSFFSLTACISKYKKISTDIPYADILYRK